MSGSNTLLPAGFYDLLFDQAYRNHENTNKVLDYFLKQGCRLIKPPLVEFEEVFLQNGIKKGGGDDLFTLIDPISGKKMVIRNDITPQICRIIARNWDAASLPIKICYIGDVLNAKTNSLYADRQQTHLGLEIIGCDKKESFIFVVESTLQSLELIGVKEMVIELSLPNFLENFCEEGKITLSNDLRSAITKKNLSKISKLIPSQSEIIKKIVTTNQGLEDLVSSINSSSVLQKLEKLKEVIASIEKKFPTVGVKFDLFGDRFYSYHKELFFEVFSKSFNYPVARGGNYYIESEKCNCVGSTIYVNNLRKIDANYG